MKHLKLLSFFSLISFLISCSSMKEMNGTFVHLDKNKKIENSEFIVYIPEIVNKEGGLRKIYKSGDFKIQYPKKQNIVGTSLIISDKKGDFIAKKTIPAQTNHIIVLYNGCRNKIVFVKEGRNFNEKYATALEAFKKLANTNSNHTPIYPGCENCGVENYSSCFDNKVNQHIARYLDVRSSDIPSGRKKINVLFEVDKTGKVNITSVNSPNQELKREVIKVLKKLPIMKPAMKDNQPVKTEYSFPVIIIN